MLLQRIAIIGAFALTTVTSAGAAADGGALASIVSMSAGSR
ncbi:hypothetical protein [Burkholderia sp. IMCC1007]|nr:hypothetical protein [Burkholderia sp. IMCC1007]